MKLTVIFTLIAVSYGEKLDRAYLPPNAQASGGNDVLLQTPVSRPIVVLEDDDIQRQISASAQEEVQRPITNVVEVQRPIVTNVVTDSAALKRPIGFAVNVNNQAVNDVVHIGNRGNIFVTKPNPVQYNEVQYSEPRYQIVEQRPERTQAALERNAAVLRQEYKNEGDAYAYAYETENGIWAEENGVATNGVNSHGAYSYIGDDGVQYSMSYTADENGFQPQGDHLPTPHPIPEEILRSLEQNARDEAAGIFDDGSYDELKYGGEYAGNQQIGIVSVTPSYPNVPTLIENRPTAPTVFNQIASNEESVITNPLLPKFRNPGYRYTNILVNQRSNLPPAVNSLIQDVTPSTVNKAYLPPVKRKVPSDKLSTKPKGRTVVVIKNRKPVSKKDENKS